MSDADTVAHGDWSTSTFECLKDEETCWWGTWCCWLVSARTAQSFDVGSSYRQTVGFVLFVVICFVVAIIIPPIGFLLFIAGLFYYAFYRAQLRTEIRKQFSIAGSLMGDFILHAFCCCCAVCQEGREAKVRDTKKLDFCYGEDLSNLNFPQESSTLTEAINEQEDAGLLNELKNISMVSHLIIRSTAVLATLIFVSLILGDRAQNFAVLLLVFVQPFLILYFVYWRYRRQHASLDYVIKLFAVGYFLATTQAIVLESTLEAIMGLVIAMVLGFFGYSVASSPDEAGSIIAPSNNEGFFSSRDVDYLSNGLTNDIMHILGYNNYHSDLYMKDNGDGEEEGDDATGNFDSSDLRKFFPLVVVVLFIMAFVIAAGVEETMKHFTVRCCRFPAPLKDPQSIMVYLMAGALGFATSENVEYVFGTTSSPIPGTSIFVGELFVLLIRVLMPIHVICSVLQATNLSKVLMGQSQMGLIEILLPAIALHGSFDFILFLMGAIQAAFEIESIAFEVFSYILPVLITIGGVYWAYVSFNKVVEGFGSGFRAFPANDTLAEVNL